MAGKIIIAGGTGVLGRLLSRTFARQGRETVVLSRSHAGVQEEAVKRVYWDGRTQGDWVGELEGASAVINLAGRSINTRFTASNKMEIRESRVLSTTLLGNAISRCNQPPATWINAGGISIYQPSATVFTENDLPAGVGFLADLSRQWEAAFERAETPYTRKVQLRMSPVLMVNSGMLAPLAKLAKLGLGGPVAGGHQYVSWIHGDDLVKLIGWVMENTQVSGVIHASSPCPVTNAVFMQALRERVGMPVGMPAPAWAVRLGAWLAGKEAELALDSHRVVSHVLKEAGFRFDFPEIHGALHNLML